MSKSASHGPPWLCFKFLLPVLPCLHSTMDSRANQPFPPLLLVVGFATATQGSQISITSLKTEQGILNGQLVEKSSKQKR